MMAPRMTDPASLSALPEVGAEDLETVLMRWQWNSGKLATWLRDGAGAARLSRELVTLDVRAPVLTTLARLAVGWGEGDVEELRKIARKQGLPILLDAQALPKREVDAGLEERWIAACAAYEAR